MKMDFDLRDLNRAALERVVKQLLVASEGEEKKILDRLSDAAADSEKESNDLADLKEEKRGKPNPISMEEGNQSRKKQRA